MGPRRTGKWSAGAYPIEIGKTQSRDSACDGLNKGAGMHRTVIATCPGPIPCYVGSVSGDSPGSAQCSGGVSPHNRTSGMSLEGE